MDFYIIFRRSSSLAFRDHLVTFDLILKREREIVFNVRLHEKVDLKSWD